MRLTSFPALALNAGFHKESLPFGAAWNLGNALEMSPAPHPKDSGFHGVQKGFSWDPTGFSPIKQGFSCPLKGFAWCLPCFQRSTFSHIPPPRLAVKPPLPFPDSSKPANRPAPSAACAASCAPRQATNSSCPLCRYWVFCVCAFWQVFRLRHWLPVERGPRPVNKARCGKMLQGHFAYLARATFRSETAIRFKRPLSKLSVWLK